VQSPIKNSPALAQLLQHRFKRRAVEGRNLRSRREGVLLASAVHVVMQLRAISGVQYFVGGLDFALAC